MANKSNTFRSRKNQTDCLKRHLKKWPDRAVEPDQLEILINQKEAGEITESDFAWLLGKEEDEQ